MANIAEVIRSGGAQNEEASMRPAQTLGMIGAAMQQNDQNKEVLDRQERTLKMNEEQHQMAVADYADKVTGKWVQQLSDSPDAIDALLASDKIADHIEASRLQEVRNKYVVNSLQDPHMAMLLHKSNYNGALLKELSLGNGNWETMTPEDQELVNTSVQQIGHALSLQEKAKQRAAMDAQTQGAVNLARALLPVEKEKAQNTSDIQKASELETIKARGDEDRKTLEVKGPSIASTLAKKKDEEQTQENVGKKLSSGVKVKLTDLANAAGMSSDPTVKEGIKTLDTLAGTPDGRKDLSNITMIMHAIGTGDKEFQFKKDGEIYDLTSASDRERMLKDASDKFSENSTAYAVFQKIHNNLPANDDGKRWYDFALPKFAEKWAHPGDVGTILRSTSASSN